MSNLVECDLCGEDSDSDEMQYTECGKRFCPSCDSDGEVYWISCDDTGEEWAYLA